MKNVYISSCTPDGGVRLFAFDGEALTQRAFSPAGRVMYTAREGGVLYAAALERDGLDSFVVRAALTDGVPGPFGGKRPTGRESCFIDVRDGDFYTADYSSAGVTKNGVQTVTHSGCGTDPARQEAPHPHQALVTPDGKFVLVCDLGLDRVFVYDRDLTPVSYADVPKGQGVRHLTFAPDGRRVYAVNELGCSITEFDYADCARPRSPARAKATRAPSGCRRTAACCSSPCGATTSSPSASRPRTGRFCCAAFPAGAAGRATSPSAASG